MNEFFFNLTQILPDRIKQKFASQKHTAKKLLSNQFKTENEELLAKFEATLLGSLIGDCFGRKCEGIWGSSLAEVIEEFRQIKENNLLESTSLEIYSDDTTLNKAICQSFINKSDFELNDMANQFQKAFLKDSSGNFCDSTATLFKKLNSLKKSNQLEEKCLLPAMEMYNDICLSDNGAVRCAPIALFTYFKSMEEMRLICELSTKLTHNHDWAVIGAIQQCYAVREAFNHSKVSHEWFDLDIYFLQIVQLVEDLEMNFKILDKINYENMAKYSPSLVRNFLLYLNQKTQMIECNNNSLNYGNLELKDNSLIKDYVEYLESGLGDFKFDSSYSNLLKRLHRMIKRCRRGEKINIESLYKQLGKFSCLSSIQAIPIALFTFMIAADTRCRHEINHKLMTSVDVFKEYNSIERVILYAISYGGDTDRVCSMAGAIAGAYSLEHEVPVHLAEKCVSYKEISSNAHKLYELCQSQLSNNNTIINTTQQTDDNNNFCSLLNNSSEIER